MARERPTREAIELADPNTGRTFPSRDSHDSVPDSPPEKDLYLKLISSGFSFFVAGVNDGSLGALIPHLILSYRIQPSTVAAIYGVTFTGWLTAALSNDYLRPRLDLGVLLFLGAILQTVAHALRCWLAPFGLFTASFWMASLGQAYQDTHANNFVATVKGAHRWLGFIHGMYAAGCLVGPFAATAVASAQTPPPWNLFYTIPLGLGAINTLLVVIAFRDRFSVRRVPTGNHENAGPADDGAESPSALKQMGATLRLPSVWLLSVFFLFYLGAAITAGGWLVEYLVAVRKGDLSKMGYVPAGFYGGTLLGRLLLAEPTHRFGERRMLLLYLLLCLVFQLLFWLVPNIIAASVAISLLGFFLGPLFAAGVSVGSQLFPSALCSSALAFMFVLGQIGGSIFPAITGVIASHAGVQVLQPMLVGLLVATAISWVLVPKKSDTHQD